MDEKEELSQESSEKRQGLGKVTPEVHSAKKRRPSEGSNTAMGNPKGKNSESKGERNNSEATVDETSLTIETDTAGHGNMSDSNQN